MTALPLDHPARSAHVCQRTCEGFQIGDDHDMTRRALSSGDLQIRFWGVRGSTCASGPQFVEFGSHTPCVEIRCGERLFIIDAGTGLAALGIPSWQHGARHRRHSVQPSASRSHQRPAVLQAGASQHRPGHPHLLRQSRRGERRRTSLDRLYSPPLFPDHVSTNCRRNSNITASRRATRCPSPTAPGSKRTSSTIRAARPATASPMAAAVVCYISDIEHTDPWPDPGPDRVSCAMPT